MFDAKAVIAYSSPIDDHLCFLAEPQLVGLLQNGFSASRAVAQVRANMAPWKSSLSKGKKKYPLECFE